MRLSMAELTPLFSSNRMVREYVERLYLPAAYAYRQRAADKGAVARQVVAWRHTLEQNWANLRFGEVKVETDGGQHLFEVQVYVNGIDPNGVRVELYADGVAGNDPVRQEMMRVRQFEDSSVGYVFRGAVPAVLPAADYTPRIIPAFEGALVPIEANQILWYR